MTYLERQAHLENRLLNYYANTIRVRWTNCDKETILDIQFFGEGTKFHRFIFNAFCKKSFRMNWEIDWSSKSFYFERCHYNSDIDDVFRTITNALKEYFDKNPNEN